MVEGNIFLKKRLKTRCLIGVIVVFPVADAAMAVIDENEIEPTRKMTDTTREACA